jgi:ribosomal protein S18 acetylase RimI-like enzyme
VQIDHLPAVYSQDQPVPEPATTPEATPQFRAGTRADHAFVSELARTAFAPLGHYEDVLPRWLGDPTVATVIALDGELPVGFSMLGYYRPTGGAVVGDVLAIAVAPGARGRGFGARLLARTLALADELAGRLRARELRLSVAEDNGTARRLFAGAGFVEAATEPGRYEGGQRALRLVRARAG